MSGLPEPLYTDVINAAPAVGSLRQKRPIRRNRESLACKACKLKKLKCDKRRPCGACQRRNDAAACVYQTKSEAAGIGANRNGNVGGDVKSAEQRMAAEERLEHLESLVRQLVQSKGNSASSESPYSRNSRPSADRNTPSDSEPGDDDSVYVGSTHWSAMLDDIKELKAVIRSEGDDDDYLEETDALPATQDFDSLFGNAQSLSLQNILSTYLPPKIEVDRCVAAYFRSKVIAGPFIHSVQFMRQYREFWENPLESLPLWVSVLFSICLMSTKVCLAHEVVESNAPGSQTREERFLIGAAQCLVLGRYYQPKRWAIEAVTFFIQCKCSHSLDPSREIGVLLGTMIKLCHILGYNKDPSNIKDLSVFEKEMRRRTWAACMQIELLLSFQLGIPSSIQISTWNTKLPSNLIDSDFNEDSLEMPVSRPDSEPTRILFFIAKQKLMITFQRVFRHAISFNHNDEAELDAIDREVRETYSSLPKVVQGRQLDDALADEAFLLASRHCVEFIYMKSMCVLHRPYVMQGREKSVRACIESASGLVQRFLSMYPEFGLGGQLYTHRWLFGSLLWNDFLLGINGLCLVIAAYSRKPTSAAQQNMDNIKALLQSAYKVCSETAHRSMGAQRICRLLDVILNQTNDSIGIENLALEAVVDQTRGSRHNPAVSPNMRSGPDNVIYQTLPQPDQSYDHLSQMDWSDFFEQPLNPEDWLFLQSPNMMPDGISGSTL